MGLYHMKKLQLGRLEDEALILLVLREGYFVENDAAIAPPQPQPGPRRASSRLPPPKIFRA